MNLDKALAIARLTCTVAASIAAGFVIALEADELFVGAACLMALICYIWSWWKNNNITSAAREAQKVLDAIRAGKDGG